ncbi:hypothetical protein CTEN210_01164 [Chaetoceros tenuissimus]|uniref:Cyclic nucleotide-binding domain-containing protein n=1 Tax=Chaetoceros tenuissimus TaxID=426638 RepID=A0AAD3GZE5_9STRA|nr:hypothetical protein CTEN210_01164 [Chaetoceros tenuissimus]
MWITSLEDTILVLSFCWIFSTFTCVTAFLQTTTIISKPTTTSNHFITHNINSIGSPISDILLSATRTKEELDFIIESFNENDLFRNLQSKSYKEIINALELKEADQNEIIVRQGDLPNDDNYVYLIAEGECSVIVDGEMVPEPYGTMKAGLVFGDLAVLYNEERAATIQCKTEKVKYFRIDGDVFKRIVNTPKETLEGMKEIDNLINQVSGTLSLYDGDIIPPYKPERVWLWQQYSNTILKISWETTAVNMALSALFVLYARDACGIHESIWVNDFATPDGSLPFIERLTVINQIWDIGKPLTTFVLTFFVNQAFGFWNKVYDIAREVQQKISNYNLIIATNVKRDKNGFTLESEEFLDDIGQYSRLFHILVWASKSNRFSALATPDGLRRMESRGLMTAKQLEILLEVEQQEFTNEQLCNAPLQWIMVRSTKAMEDGILASDTATKGVLLKDLGFLRNANAAVSSKLSARFPLAYVQFVQVLVDSFIFSAPVALYADLGIYSIPAVGVLTLFYSGLNNLAKIFLDPLNNEEFCDNSIFMDLGVLIRETNEITTQWKKSSTNMPF